MYTLSVVIAVLLIWCCTYLGMDLLFDWVVKREVKQKFSKKDILAHPELLQIKRYV